MAAPLLTRESNALGQIREREKGQKLGHCGYWGSRSREDTAECWEGGHTHYLAGRPSLRRRDWEQDLAAQLGRFFTLGKTFSVENGLRCEDCSEFASLASPMYSLWLYANKIMLSVTSSESEAPGKVPRHLGNKDKRLLFSNQSELLHIYIPAVKR